MTNHDATPVPIKISTVSLREENERLKLENELLRNNLAGRSDYIRQKLDQMLAITGALPFRPEELDDETLVGLDPIGIATESFRQILSDQREVNRKLDIANQETAAIFEATGVGIMVLDNEMRILSFNKKLKDNFFPHLADSDVMGLGCRQLICQGNEPIEGCLFKLVQETNSAARTRTLTYQGHSYDVVFTPVYDQNGNITKCLGLYHDISDVKHGEQALLKSEERYRDLFENANDLIQSVGPDGRFIYTNRTWRDTLGYSETEVEKLSMFDIIKPSCHPHCIEMFGLVMSGEILKQVEVVFVAKDGKEIIVEGSVNCSFENGHPVATRSIFRDITARKKAEEALAAEKERLAVTLRSIGDGVITTDTEGRIVLINQVAEQLTGWSQEESSGQLLDQVFHIINDKTGEGLENPAEKVLKTGTTATPEKHTALIAKNGAKRMVADSGAPICSRDGHIIGTVLVFRDITEQQVLEVNLQRAEKLESLGVLAGGIAHDFNNMLTGIIGNISIAMLYAGTNQSIMERLNEAEKAAFRARDLTQQLLTFARGGAPVKKTVSITQMLTDLSSFALRGSNVRCCFGIPEDLWSGNMDAGQISQVIQNLVINAVQAMPQGGQIILAAQNMVVTGSEGLPLKKGRYVHLSIGDTGTGIAAEHLPMIFDPYFTTKAKGTGLGLATSYSIVKNHDGYITVESELGVGTTFHIYLPASLKQATAAGTQQIDPMTGSGRILVMDDEEMVRNVAAAFLRMVGYRVDLAHHGEQALEMYRQALNSKEPFDAVIMDLTIPGGMGGKETIKHLLTIDPRVKALVSSGYSTDPVMADYRRHGFQGVVLKPYAIEDLNNTLHRLLNSAPSSSSKNSRRTVSET